MLLAAVGFALAIACREHARPSADTFHVSRPVAVVAHATDSVRADVQAVCSELASGWRAIPNVVVHASNDSMMDAGTLHAWGVADTSVVHGCAVIAEDSGGFARADSARISRDGPGKFTYWHDYQRAGWVLLVHSQADGPDGSEATYQRGLVRCLLSEHWDGGDDSDSTYVPSPWYRQETSCWWHGRPLTVQDTTSG